MTGPDLRIYLSDWRDLNSRPSVPQITEICPRCPSGPLVPVDSGLRVWRVCPCPSGCVNSVQWGCNADGILSNDWTASLSSHQRHQSAIAGSDTGQNLFHELPIVAKCWIASLAQDGVV